MNCRSLRWLTQLLTSLILIASVRPSSTCSVLPTISYVTSTVPQIGDTVVLNCSFTGDQNGGGGVSWTKDSSLIITSNQLTNPCTCFSQSNGVSGSILFINVSNVDTDYGKYKCTALVGFGEACIDCVTVQKPVPPVLLAVGSTSQTANQSSTVAFSVSLTNPGTPLASVVWSKNGVPLSNTSNMVVTSTMLQLSNIQAGDRGQYVVMATNKAGSSSISFSLFVQFIIVTINRDASGMVTCTAMSYPRITTLLLKETTSQTIITTTTNSNILNNFTYQAITVLSGSADCSQQYSCDGVVTLAAMMTITNGTVDRCAPVSNPMLTFKPVGYNGMFIQWSPAAGSAPITYMIRYRVSGTSPYLEAPPILCGTVCNTTVTGLTLGETYGFSVGMFPEQSVVAMQGLAPVTGVVAIPSSSYVTISWNKVPRATGYLILISQGTNSSFIQNVTMATNSTSVPGLTCGALYTFKVQAYNALNLSSPSPSDGIQTTNYCSSSPGILSATADGTIVKVTLFNLNSVVAVKITVTSDSGMVYYYNPSSLGDLCLGGLSQGTLFTVCASFNLEAGYAVDDCYAQKVLTGVGTSSLLCGQFVMNPSGTIAGPTSETAGVQPWIIGVLVVGLLGLVATIFCVMGMYLACRPDKTDQANFGSSLSLDTATSPNSQTHNPSFKAVSPPTSCLSRSTKSHNISWKDQMDTIRQLETNGTNV